MTHIRDKDFITAPTAIIIAGLFIAASIYLGAQKIASNGAAQAVKVSAAQPLAAQKTAAPVNTAIKVAQVTSKDHVRGDVNAKVKIVEYSDLECPFCKKFHDTMKRIVATYDKSDVAWVYRHFPLDIHPNARKEAEATECAAELGGEAKFWEFTDRLFDVSPGNNRFDLAELPNIAEYVGLDRKAFETCLASGKYASKIQSSIVEGGNAGAKGTPYSVIVTSKGNLTLGGAVPFEQVDAKIKEALGR